LWDIIQAQKESRCTVLTTHSMEEAQALCQRIGIMVNGNLQCLGSSQHLKSKFGSGYTLEIKSSDDLSSVVQEIFPDAILEESINGRLRYLLPILGNRISVVFDSLMKLTEKYEVQDWAISQSSLEQVFINFAKKQIERE